ncbi:TIGR03759 family integrating conjugative element protein [Pseudomonas batumici]|uniref:Putative exported protein n=1 Tax=Pseudomonas batumici TaxID=226910 RepID=A0A0C2I4E9_9PSED|nr:TIGR03759 family integrating conjugative element protein [Pseudomonas batumici]KIH84091.1 putative exported protein [Pseudomonas batumici]
MNVSPLCLLLSGACLLLPSVVQAEALIPLAVESTPHTQLQEHPTQALEQVLATEWGLKPEEWQRYRRLMQGPLGVYSPNLDPLTALGIEARDSQEQQRYAEQQVQAEFARVQKLLAYQNAYNDAFQRLYPGQLPVNLMGTESTAQASPVTSSVRLAVFVTTNCKNCPERVRQLQQTAQGFDLYLVDSLGKDDRLRAWAKRAGIEPQKVLNRDITLNHDAGHWARLGDNGAFPAVMRQVNGQWQRQ